MIDNFYFIHPMGTRPRPYVVHNDCFVKRSYNKTKIILYTHVSLHCEIFYPENAYNLISKPKNVIFEPEIFDKIIKEDDELFHTMVKDNNGISKYFDNNPGEKYIIMDEKLKTIGLDTSFDSKFIYITIEGDLEKNICVGYCQDYYGYDRGLIVGIDIIDNKTISDSIDTYKENLDTFKCMACESDVYLEHDFNEYLKKWNQLTKLEKFLEEK